MPDDENLASEIHLDENLENVADLGAVERHAEDDEVGRLRVQDSRQLTGLAALAGDETEIFKSIGKKGPKVLFAVDDAGPRHDLSMTEPGASRVFFGIELIHAPPFQQMCEQSYIAVVAAKMEFSGRAHECFGRVKGATEIKTLATTARNRAVTTLSHRIRSFVAVIILPERECGPPGSDASQSDALMPVVVCRSVHSFVFVAGQKIAAT
ncbi:MAG: hypothetical protein JF604_07235 [Bradyrhizobium sp.]|nr:hypothetical protein [Bradyrhizobium sp.]